jgi:hypothetical protein
MRQEKFQDKSSSWDIDMDIEEICIPGGSMKGMVLFYF